ncbi:MAG: hypothetical protein RIS70_3181, partial [Planctomycetota bacterium]
PLLESEPLVLWPFVLAVGSGVVFCKISGKVRTKLLPWLELGR